MQEMSRAEFERQKNDAANRIREMYKGQKSPTFPSFVSVPAATEQPQEKDDINVSKEIEKKPSCTPANNIFKFLNFSEILKSPDSLLILGLILLLIGDNADEKLILALVFIML